MKEFYTWEYCRNQQNHGKKILALVSLALLALSDKSSSAAIFLSSIKNLIHIQILINTLEIHTTI